MTVVPAATQRGIYDTSEAAAQQRQDTGNAVRQWQGIVTAEQAAQRQPGSVTAARQQA